MTTKYNSSDIILDIIKVAIVTIIAYILIKAILSAI